MIYTLYLSPDKIFQPVVLLYYYLRYEDGMSNESLRIQNVSTVMSLSPTFM